MKTTKEELLAAVKEHVAILKEEVRMRKEYPSLGVCNAEDAWRDFGQRERASTENLKRLSKCK